jgi:hypothetical protein
METAALFILKITGARASALSGICGKCRFFCVLLGKLKRGVSLISPMQMPGQPEVDLLACEGQPTAAIIGAPQNGGTTAVLPGVFFSLVIRVAATEAALLKNHGH